MKKKFHNVKTHVVETAVLVGVILKGKQDEDQLKEYLDELAFLAETAGVKTLSRFTQKLDNPNPKTFLGKGKLEEVIEYVKANKVW